MELSSFFGLFSSLSFFLSFFCENLTVEAFFMCTKCAFLLFMFMFDAERYEKTEKVCGKKKVETTKRNITFNAKNSTITISKFFFYFLLLLATL